MALTAYEPAVPASVISPLDEGISRSEPDVPWAPSERSLTLLFHRLDRKDSAGRDLSDIPRRRRQGRTLKG